MLDPQVLCKHHYNQAHNHNVQASADHPTWYMLTVLLQCWYHEENIGKKPIPVTGNLP